MQTAQQTLPTYKIHVLENDHDKVASLALDPAEREKVFQMCSILSSPSAPEWVHLVASWGFDLDLPSVVSDSARTQNWLWGALRNGKIDQALALVQAGFTKVDVDSDGQSGLGLLVRETYHEGLDRLLDMLTQFRSSGLDWSAWPDALDFDVQMRKNVGYSLGELMSARSAKLLEEGASPSAVHGVPVRL